MITEQNIRRCIPDGPANLSDFVPHLRKYTELYGINTPLLMSHFLAQVAHESGGFNRLQESLNYSVDALLSMFGRHRISEADARAFGRRPGRPANQQAIANALYGGSWGRTNLGNVQPGDGWLFRGRGLKQTTGRANYRRASERMFGDLRLLENPDLLLQPEHAVHSACVFWADKKLNTRANAGATPAVVESVTRVVNGGTIGLPDRIARFNVIHRVLTT